MNTEIVSPRSAPPPNPVAKPSRPSSNNARPVTPARLAHHTIESAASNPQLTRFSQGRELSRLSRLSDADFGASIRSIIDANRVDLLEQIPKPWLFTHNHHPESRGERVCYGQPHYQDHKTTLLHYAIEHRQYPSLQVLVKKLPELISLEGLHGLTAVQLAAAKGDVESIRIITSQDESCLRQINDTGNTALWQAIMTGQLEAICYIVSNWPDTARHFSTYDGNYAWYDYQSLYALVLSKKTNRQILQFFLEKTPGLFNSRSRIADLLRAKATHNNEDCIRWLFTLKTTWRMLSSISCYPYFVRLSTNLPALFREMQSQRLVPPKPIKGFDFTTYKATLCQLTERHRPLSCPASGITAPLDLSTQNADIHYLHTTKAFMASISNIGVYLNIITYPDETADGKTYATLGDLSASVRLMDRLIDLGARSVSLFVAVTSGRNRLELDSDALVTGMNKLGLLLSINKPLTDGLSIERSGCTVKVTLLNKLPVADRGKAQRELPAVMFSFSVVTEQFSGIDEFYHADDTSFITIRPYDFYKNHEYLLTDIDTGRDKANSIPLHLPEHSVIQLSVSSLFEHDDNTTSDEGNRRSLFARQAVDKMCAMVHRQQLDISVVYGLHCPGSLATTLSQWVRAVKQRLNGRHVGNRPVIIAVFPNNSEEVISMLHYLNTELKIPLLDLNHITAKHQLNRLTNSNVFLAKMPNLPRATFDMLVNTSNYPVLSEGANLTSYLLQTGHPYLSVLPVGNTSIPQNIGDALEGMKANALSYKLLNTENDPNTRKLEELCQKIDSEHFAEALTMVEDIRESGNYCNLTFLWDTPAASDRPKVVPLVTVATLLKKFKMLKEDGKAPARPALNALKAAVDPTLNCYVDFLNNCQDHSSATVYHAKLMQRHTCRPVNSSLCRAIAKFLQHKGVPCRFT